MPKHKMAQLQKMLSLQGYGSAASSTALPLPPEQRSSENILDNVESQSGPCDAAQPENLGSSLMQESYLKMHDSFDNSGSHPGEKKQNLYDISSGADDQQRPLHIVWPHRW